MIKQLSGIGYTTVPEKVEPKMGVVLPVSWTVLLATVRFCFGACLLILHLP